MTTAERPRAGRDATVGLDSRLLVVGVGNRDRGDDAAGPSVCDLVAAACGGRIDTIVCEGSTVDLATAWDGRSSVIVVDAAEPAGRPGRITEVDGRSRLLARAGAISTHGIDVPTAIGLAAAIDGLPGDLTVIGIEGATFDDGARMTPEVRDSVSVVVGSIIRRADRRAG